MWQLFVFKGVKKRGGKDEKETGTDFTPIKILSCLPGAHLQDLCVGVGVCLNISKLSQIFSMCGVPFVFCAAEDCFFVLAIIKEKPDHIQTSQSSYNS